MKKMKNFLEKIYKANYIDNTNLCKLRELKKFFCVGVGVEKKFSN